MSVSKTASHMGEDIRGWGGTLSLKMENIEFMLGWEQHDPTNFLEVVDDLEEIINDIKDHFKTKYDLPRTESSSDEEDEEDEDTKNEK